MKKTSWVVSILLLLLAGKALGDYAIKDGNNVGQTVFSFVCQATKICPASVLIDATGAQIGTTANPIVTYDNVYQWSNLGYCQITSLSSATALSSCSGTYGSGVAAGATAVLINFEVANIRETGDGTTTPTSTVGMRHYAGTWWEYSGSLANLKFIQESSGGILNVTFLK